MNDVVKVKAQSSDQEGGFSMLQLLIVMAVLTVIVAFAVSNVAAARQRLTLTNTAREIVRNLEQTRTDSISRHADTAAQRSSVQVVNASTYSVTKDFNANGIIDAGEVRNITLPDGVTFNLETTPPPVSYDWRGRTGTNSIRITVQNSTGFINIDVGGGGDISLNSNITLPGMTATPYPTPTPTLTPISTPTPTPTPPPPAMSSECTVSANVTAITIRQNGITTGQVNITLDVYGNPGTVTPSYNSSNLSVSPSSASVNAGSTATFSIRDVKGGGKDYKTTVTFQTPCGDRDVEVTVTN